jgi:hypothetical protein
VWFADTLETREREKYLTRTSDALKRFGSRPTSSLEAQAQTHTLLGYHLGYLYTQKIPKVLLQVRGARS